ncbi:peptide chain release factor [Chitinophaga costaii]|uniref:Peptide chain release factor n=1 Tax=Chitinophaga costaii TaxID=1335309 RepID=A0A1C4EZX6_9BACT|nr:peptide chain release factor H [Chitinophaga costaii]PUZ21520.1 peptide chain release factor H [Chitinophaga costaii]SCC48993.1 peptide chain release factor [Chitinophaga costaii]
MHNYIFLQISAGHGPAECSRVVAKLLPLLLQSATAAGLEATVTDKAPGALPDTLHSVLLRLKGGAAAAWLREWEGTVQWIAQSPFRPTHGRKNWFVSVQSFTPAAQAVPAGAITYKTTRASGPGGQHVNKTETAVWAIHAAAGLRVLASDSRSQHQNKKLATERLLQQLYALEMKAQLARVQDQWTQHTQLQRGGAIKVFTAPLT